MNENMQSVKRVSHTSNTPIHFEAPPQNSLHILINAYFVILVTITPPDYELPEGWGCLVHFGIPRIGTVLGARWAIE